MRDTHEWGMLYTLPQRREVDLMGVASKRARGGKLVRTNVVLDDALVRKAMKLTGIDTKREVLDEALRTLVRLREQEGIWDLYGRVEWEGDLQEMRKGRVFDGGR